MNKVDKSQMDTLPKIVAVDFDGTLVNDEYPNIGALRPDIFNLCKYLKQHDVRLILWTSRDGEYLEQAVSFCEQHGLIFDAVNQNIPETIEMFHNDTRKVYADLYLDDKSISIDTRPHFWLSRVGIPAERWIALYA